MYKCTFVITRGPNRGKPCNRSCYNELCGSHRKLYSYRKEHGLELNYKECRFCSTRTRSKYGVCYVCLLTRNIKYHVDRNNFRPE